MKVTPNVPPYLVFFPSGLHDYDGVLSYHFSDGPPDWKTWCGKKTDSSRVWMLEVHAKKLGVPCYLCKTTNKAFSLSRGS